MKKLIALAIAALLCSMGYQQQALALSWKIVNALTDQYVIIETSNTTSLLKPGDVGYYENDTQIGITAYSMPGNNNVSLWDDTGSFFREGGEFIVHNYDPRYGNAELHVLKRSAAVIVNATRFPIEAHGSSTCGFTPILLQTGQYGSPTVCYGITMAYAIIDTGEGMPKIKTNTFIDQSAPRGFFVVKENFANPGTFQIAGPY